MGVKVYLSIDQGELLGELRGVEVGGRKGRGSDDESRSATQNLRVDKNGGGLGVLQCRNGGSTDREGRDVDVRQQIVVSWAWQRHNTAEMMENAVQSQRRPKLLETCPKLG
ncbi:hypothetical protein BHM03_00004413 [Ensete ventricosum]|nr:hypothetical protein BHM03_00004413 [Ensete ventricosum]